jgi:hypothetical protein
MPGTPKAHATIYFIFGPLPGVRIWRTGLGIARSWPFLIGHENLPVVSSRYTIIVGNEGLQPSLGATREGASLETFPRYENGSLRARLRQGQHGQIL